MKQRFGIKGLVFLLCITGMLHAEQVKFFGDYVTPGDVNGDLVVVNGSVNVLGNLNVNGDLKVTSGYVIVSGGDLKVNGDLIVTNTKASQTPSDQDATVTVSGDLYVNGALITKSTEGSASVEVWDPMIGTVGSMHAARISTRGWSNAHVMADHHITVTGAIVTKSVNGYAYVKSNGLPSIWGNVYAGSIYTYSPLNDAYVHVENGHLVVNGAIRTKSPFDAYVWTEGNIIAGSIFTRSDDGGAYISGEKVEVDGDIRTVSLSSDAYVRARMTVLMGQEGTFEDIIAQNIYTRGYNSANVRAFRSIQVRGDIVTWEPESPVEYKEIGPMAGAGVSTGDLAGRNSRQILQKYMDNTMRSPVPNAGVLEAQNIITRGAVDASVEAAGGIDVSGDIITRSDWYGYVYTFSNDIKAGNIATEGVYNAFVQNETGNILVSHVISTTNPSVLIGRANRQGVGRADVYAPFGNIEAEKIFTDGNGDASVMTILGDHITVKGPIVAKSETDIAQVYAQNDITAGAISTQASMNASVNATNGSIVVREDIRTKSLNDDADVKAEFGNITARSIKTIGANDDSIQAAPGSGKFQLSLDVTDTDNALIIKDSEFDLDKDYEWNTALSLYGTCTINGKNHLLDFASQGEIIITSGATLLLKNIELKNLWGNVVRCVDDTATVSFQDVTWSQSSDTQFQNGIIHLAGGLHIKGPDTTFSYQSGMQSMIGADAYLFVDRHVTLSYDSAIINGIGMTDETSELHFDGSMLQAAQDLRLTKGTLVVDNKVTFSAENTKTIYFGDNAMAENLNFAFGLAAKLTFTRVINENV